ncbi:hypothetical protein IGI04_020174, partial [Brassica rapa subsp. trilocularis]
IDGNSLVFMILFFFLEDYKLRDLMRCTFSYSVDVEHRPIGLAKTDIHNPRERKRKASTVEDISREDQKKV